MSRRSIDMHAESALADFLDTYFYSRLLDEGLFSSIERIHDISDMQYRITPDGFQRLK